MSKISDRRDRMVEKHLASLERLGQEDRASVIAAVVAQLRHAYHNLIGPEAAWDRDQRMRFADKLIAPQIVKLEAALAVPPVPTAGWQEHHCKTCTTAMWCNYHRHCLAESAPPSPPQEPT